MSTGRACLSALLLAANGLQAAAEGLPPAAAPPGSIARGEGARRAALAEPGPPVDAPLLRLGAERYAIYCVPCHGAAGAGDGAVVARGFPRPPPVQGLEAARSMAAIARNLGGSHPFDDRIPPRDRWAIARHIEAMPR